MNIDEAKRIILEDFAKHVVKYPRLTVELQKYIKNHHNKDLALAECTAKLNELDKYVNFLFYDEIPKKV